VATLSSSFERATDGLGALGVEALSALLGALLGVVVLLLFAVSFCSNPAASLAIFSITFPKPSS
jgi:hypothetical protein